MTSWMMHLQAQQALPAGVKVVAGVFFAGGSHMCYQNPPYALSQCAECNADSSGFAHLLVTHLFHSLAPLLPCTPFLPCLARKLVGTCRVPTPSL
jgi:7-cyano-7-deazaguanine synthase in queuosine biosynthesis